MSQYKEYKNRSGELSCILFGSKAIPFDPANTDYAQFKKAVLEGAELQDAEGNTMSTEQATQFVKELP